MSAKVVITGSSLTLDELVSVARENTPVELGRDVAARMTAARALIEAALERRDPVYGLTTGVAAQKRIFVEPKEAPAFNRALIRSHLIGQGSEAESDVVRATMLRLANYLASGLTGARVELAQALATSLNEGLLPRVRMLGSVGQSDLGAMADIANGLLSAPPLAGFSLGPGEAIALLNNNSFGTALSALAVTDLERLLDSLDIVGALSLEGFAANLSILDPGVEAARPYPGLAFTLARIRSALDGSDLWRAGAARNLQDPLTFRGIPQLHGALRDAITFAKDRLSIELNAGQGNPMVSPASGRSVSVANFDILPLAAAVDLLRVALAPVVTASAERSIKLLMRPWSGLPPGLMPAEGSPESGLGELAVAVVALAAEARLLAQPVSFEIPSSSIAEGLEDRMTMAPLGARRLGEMVGLGQRVAAIELLAAGQAVEIRGTSPLGQGTGRALHLLRQRVPFVHDASEFPADLEPLRELMASGSLSPR